MLGISIDLLFMQKVKRLKLKAESLGWLKARHQSDGDRILILPAKASKGI